VVRVSWDAREWRSCTSDYRQIAFPHLQVRTNAQEWYRRNATGTAVYDQMTTSVHWRQLLVAGHYGIEYSLASASDGSYPHGWGPRWNLGAHVKKWVRSHPIFHFNHCLLADRQTEGSQRTAVCTVRLGSLSSRLVRVRVTGRQTEGSQRTAVCTVRLGSLSSRLVLSTQWSSTICTHNNNTTHTIKLAAIDATALRPFKE